MKKELFILSLATLFSATQLAFSEEPKKQAPDESNYAPYNPPAPFSANYQYGLYYGGGLAIRVHNRVNVVMTSIINNPKENLNVKENSTASNALWAYYSSESSLDFPREELKKQSELFLTKDGKTNIAQRLSEINAEISNMIFGIIPKEEKAKETFTAKHNKLLAEAADLYRQLSENLSGDEKKTLVTEMLSKATALPEVQNQLAYSKSHGGTVNYGGGMTGAYYGGMGHTYYGGLGGAPNFGPITDPKMLEEYQKQLMQYQKHIKALQEASK